MANNTPAKVVFGDIRELIELSRGEVAVAVNSAMTSLYWHIGRRINTEILGGERAEYGKQIVSTLSRQLVEEYGSSYSVKNLRRMMQFAEAFPDFEIVVSLIRHLSWTHFLALIPMEDPLKRAFYIEICRIERWSVRTLRERINSMLYERTAISKLPEETIKKDLAKLGEGDKLTPDLVFRDPYVLDFLGLHDTYSEKDLETAIIAELQRFITELGSDFAFMARQKRITIDNRDYYIDLLFFHRRLKSLVAIDLKIGDFDAAYKGEMELYLNWLEKYESMDGEKAPIGLIMCAGKNPEHIELLRLHETNIKVADYLTILPPKHVFAEKLHKAIAYARRSLDARNTEGSDE